MRRDGDQASILDVVIIGAACAIAAIVVVAFVWFGEALLSATIDGARKMFGER